jgi:y4mF family transcriptional regulator
MWAQSTKEIGSIIAAARRQRQLTQAQLAKAVGVTQHWISAIEQGKESAQIGKVLQVLSFLGVRLQVGEASWMVNEPPPVYSPTAISSTPSLADIITAHSGVDPKPKRARR